MTQTKDTIDKNIFNDNDKKCNGYNDCYCIKRLIAALSYYQKLYSQQPQTFIDFCDKYYSKQYLEDYVHCISVHKNDINNEDKDTKTCTMVTTCASTSRHYRDRAVKDENNNNNATSHIYVDIFDALHFYVYHMVECGLRVPIHLDDFKDTENENDYSNCADKIVAAIRQEIEKKKEKCGLFKRLDNAQNSKFNIIQVTKDDSGEYDVKTD
eukprot:174257_1